MDDFVFCVEKSPSSDDVAVLTNGLKEHSLPITGIPGFLPIAVFLRDRDGTIVGGASGLINWNWLQVNLLWVSESLRGKGYGSQLLRRIESIAKEKGCTNVHLDTLSYQAQPFYVQHGYEVFGVLEEYLPSHQRIYLKKPLLAGTS